MKQENKDEQIIELLSFVLKALNRLPENHAQVREEKELIVLEDSFRDSFAFDGQNT